MAKAYIKLIPLGMGDPDALRLLDWKRPTEREDTSGDFSTVLYEVVSKRSSVLEGSMSIDDLNDILDELSKNSGKQWVLGIQKYAMVSNLNAVTFSLRFCNVFTIAPRPKSSDGSCASS